jgi:hypothetical protein
VDPEVSQRKFARELAEYRMEQDAYEAKGWFLLNSEYPIVRVLMVAANLKPPALITEVRFDYTNYDALPPSVVFVNPLTGTPLQMKEIGFPPLIRAVGPAPVLPGAPPGLSVPPPSQSLLTAHSADEVPFICVAGVREYHQHPAHTGDPWDLHRASGAGRLVRLLNVIYTYGVQPIRDYRYQLTIQVAGLMAGPPPI